MADGREWAMGRRGVVPRGDTTGQRPEQAQEVQGAASRQRGWSPGGIDRGRAVGGAMQGLPSWLELYPECNGRAEAGKDLQQESDRTRLEFLTFWLRCGGCMRDRVQ